VSELRPILRVSPLLMLLVAGLTLLPGCGQSARVSDSQLKPIEDMLDKELPPGSPSAIVNHFVTSRGYPVEPSGRTDTLTIIIRHIDRDKLQPVTARVTFHFDANDKLVSTEIVRAPNQPLPQQQPPAQ
jgi:hypothetical protein